MLTQSEISDLIEKAQSDEVQSKLSGPFQTSFIPRVVEKWNTKHYLSEREQEVLQDLLQQLCTDVKKPSVFSKRRYEGFGG